MAVQSELEQIFETISAKDLREIAARDQKAKEAAQLILSGRAREASDRYGIPARSLPLLMPDTFYTPPAGGASLVAPDFVGIGLERVAAKGANSVLIVLGGHGSAIPRTIDENGHRIPTTKTPMEKTEPFANRVRNEVVTNANFEGHMAAEHAETGCGGADGRTDLVISKMEDNRNEIMNKYLKQVGDDRYVVRDNPGMEAKVMTALSVTGRPYNCSEHVWNPYCRNFTRAGTGFLVATNRGSLPKPEDARAEEYVSKSELNDMIRPHLLEGVTGAACLDVRMELLGNDNEQFDTAALRQRVIDSRNWRTKWLMLKGESFASDRFQTLIHGESGINTLNINLDGTDPLVLQRAIALAMMPQALVNHSLRSDMWGTRRGSGQATMSPATSTLINIPGEYLTDPRYAEKVPPFVEATTQLFRTLDSNGYRSESEANAFLGSMQSEMLVKVDGEIKRVEYGQGIQVDVPKGELGEKVLDAIRPAKADRIINPTASRNNPNPAHTVYPGTERALGVQIG